MRKFFFFSIFIVGLIFSGGYYCVNSYDCKERFYLIDNGSEHDITKPSMVRVLGSPDNFISKRIYLTGYLYSDHIDSRIFVTKDHSAIFDKSSSVLLGEGARLFHTCENRYVTVVGTLAESNEFMRLKMVDIEEILNPTSLAPCWQSEVGP